MKSVFIAGSRKFSSDMENFMFLCKNNGIRAQNAGKSTCQEDTPESEKTALLRAFQIIDDSDILYAVSVGGYVGKTAAMEISYAFAKGKKIFSSEAIDELSAHALIFRILKPEELIKYILDGKAF